MNKNFTIGGQVRPVNFGRNAIREFERLTGLSFLGTASVQNIFSNVDRCVKLVFCGLKWGLYDKQTGHEPIPNFTENMVSDWSEAEEEAFWQILMFFVESNKVDAPGSSAEASAKAEGGATLKKNSLGQTSTG